MKLHNINSIESHLIVVLNAESQHIEEKYQILYFFIPIKYLFEINSLLMYI